MKCKSEWQSPATLVRIRTSRGPGFCRLTSSIASGWLTSCRTAAFIAVSSLLVFLERARSSLRRDKQFANLGHADRALAEQVSCHCALLGIFRKPERIVCRLHPVIDHHARQRKP